MAIEINSMFFVRVNHGKRFKKRIVMMIVIYNLFDYSKQFSLKIKT